MPIRRDAHPGSPTFRSLLHASKEREWSAGIRLALRAHLQLISKRASFLHIDGVRALVSPRMEPVSVAGQGPQGLIIERPARNLVLGNISRPVQKKSSISAGERRTCRPNRRGDIKRRAR